MKKVLTMLALGLMIATPSFAQDSIDGSYNAPAGSGIVGSKHDLSMTTGIGGLYGATDTLDRVCIWCHAPHNTMMVNEAQGITYLPLWNHEVTSKYYDTYQSDFGDGPDASGLAGVGDESSSNQFSDRHLFNGANTIGEPGSVSRLCLSCHDGTIAVNEYGMDPQRENSQGGANSFIADQFKIGAGGSLQNHHPIGFDYIDVSNMDDEIANPDTLMADGVTIRSLLYGNRMECVTCHDVHNSKNTGETFLWVSDANSQFCLTCHLK